jgi:hypothetical protein
MFHLHCYNMLNLITICRSASLYCCARFLVPPRDGGTKNRAQQYKNKYSVRSTCLRSANLYWCALIETTIISPSIYITQSHHYHTGVVFRL